MSPMNAAAAALRVPVLMPWMPGPVKPTVSPIIVSVTEFRANHRRELPSIAATGLHMRMGWYGMSGAVGMWLWSLPAGPCAGSISVWASEADLERFVSLPRHVEIMQRYGTRGIVRSTMWKADTFEPYLVKERACAWITEGTS
jgi:hypothetical protein